MSPPACGNLASGSPAEIFDAAKTGDAARVQELLKDTPALALSKDDRGATPLHWAAANGHKEVARLLLANKADVNARMNDGETPLHAAVRHADIVELLIEWRADIDATSYGQGTTALHMALLNDNRDAASLLSSKARIDAKDGHGDTPLILVALKGYPDVAAQLLKRGANVNASDSEGVTPLYATAILGDHVDVAELLLAHKADVEAMARNGLTPLQQAEGSGATRVAELLRQLANFQVFSEIDVSLLFGEGALTRLGNGKLIVLLDTFPASTRIELAKEILAVVKMLGESDWPGLEAQIRRRLATYNLPATDDVVRATLSRYKQRFALIADQTAFREDVHSRIQ
jgi:ankyrin repeat protein